MNGKYVGRFAPSPTGPLHFGSAVTALASYLQARTAGGVWLVRMDDIDPPREEEGAASAILHALEQLGLEWDGAVYYQSTRLEAYAQALVDLRSAGQTYDCVCTRRQVGPNAYPGTCRGRRVPGGRQHSIRLIVDDDVVAFHDLLQGECRQRLAEEVGDFIVRRADGLVAYHLATVLDDADQGITEIVRGVDLQSSTARQIYLQQVCELPTPRYCHLPNVLGRDRVKLSKQTHADPVTRWQPAAVLYAALDFLDQGPPRDLLGSQTSDILAWALENWMLGAVSPNSRFYDIDHVCG